MLITRQGLLKVAPPGYYERAAAQAAVEEHKARKTKKAESFLGLIPSLSPMPTSGKSKDPSMTTETTDPTSVLANEQIDVLIKGLIESDSLDTRSTCGNLLVSLGRRIVALEGVTNLDALYSRVLKAAGKELDKLARVQDVLRDFSSMMGPRSY